MPYFKVSPRYYVLFPAIVRDLGLHYIAILVRLFDGDRLISHPVTDKWAWKDDGKVPRGFSRWVGERAFRKLLERKLVSIIDTEDGMEVLLTDRGEKAIAQMDHKTPKIHRPRKKT